MKCIYIFPTILCCGLWHAEAGGPDRGAPRLLHRGLGAAGHGAAEALAHPGVPRVEAGVRRCAEPPGVGTHGRSVLLHREPDQAPAPAHRRPGGCAGSHVSAQGGPSFLAGFLPCSPLFWFFRLFSSILFSVSFSLLVSLSSLVSLSIISIYLGA